MWDIVCGSYLQVTSYTTLSQSFLLLSDSNMAPTDQPPLSPAFPLSLGSSEFPYTLAVAEFHIQRDHEAFDDWLT